MSNWPFLIWWTNSIPLIVMTAGAKPLTPNLGRTRCFPGRWACAIPLWRERVVRTQSGAGSVPSFCRSPPAPGEAADPSSVIFGDRSRFSLACGKHRFAAALSRGSRKKKSMGYPSVSTPRSR